MANGFVTWYINTREQLFMLRSNFITQLREKIMFNDEYVALGENTIFRHSTFNSTLKQAAFIVVMAKYRYQFDSVDTLADLIVSTPHHNTFDNWKTHEKTS